MTRRNSSGSISSNGANTEVNATLTQTSIGPSSSSTAVGGRSTASVVGDVDADRQRASAAALADLPGGGLEAVLPRASRATVVAPRGEQAGAGAADAAGGAGDDDDAWTVA